MSKEGNSAPARSPSSRLRAVLILAVSVLLLIPCFWHRRIQAGDLPSHVYNAWLAELIRNGQAPGLYLVSRYDNVLFDLALFYVAEITGLPAAEKIVVGLSVLLFSWGVFFLAARVSRRPPWCLLPAVAMLAYGYSFHMGFFNYYLSIGLACFVLGLLWRSRAGNWPWALLATPLVLLAHPIGFLWLLGTLAYRFLRARLPGWWKLMLPLGTLAGFVGIHWYLSCCATFPVDWDHRALYLLTGADQLHLFGDRYATLSWCVLAFVALSAALELAAQRKRKRRWLRLVPLLELYAVALFSTALLPENLRPSVTAGWIGLLVSRLSTITAILGLCVLALFRPSKLHLTGFAALAAVFFAFLYQDTAWLSRLESNAVATLATLPKGTRIIPAIEAAPDSRITFVGHIADRACIGRCFSYSNYEPPSKQFRVRVRAEGSPLVSASEDDAENMEGGGYEVKNSDPPLQLLYQCQPADLSKLCLRPLHPGELTDPAAVQESSPP